MNTQHFCCDPKCPGYPWKASEARHPCGMTPDPDPYTRAQELREGAEPTSQERIALQAHLDMREFTPTFNRIVAAHLPRMTILAILSR